MTIRNFIEGNAVMKSRAVRQGVGVLLAMMSMNLSAFATQLETIDKPSNRGLANFSRILENIKNNPEEIWQLELGPKPTFTSTTVLGAAPEETPMDLVKQTILWNPSEDSPATSNLEISKVPKSMTYIQRSIELMTSTAVDHNLPLLKTVLEDLLTDAIYRKSGLQFYIGAFSRAGQDCEFFSLYDERNEEVLIGTQCAAGSQNTPKPSEDGGEGGEGHNQPPDNV